MVFTMKNCNIIYKSIGGLGKNEFSCKGTYQNKGELSLIKFSYNNGEELADYSFSILKNNILRLTKKGDVSYTLVFDETNPYSTNAESLGFKIPITLNSNKIKITTSDNSITIFLDYKLNVGGNVSFEKITLSVNF